MSDTQRSLVERARPSAVRPRDPAPAASPSFAALLLGLHESVASGVLEVRADGICTRLMLRSGAPIFAEGGALRETLGRILLRRGRIGEGDYVRVIERMTERLIENEAIRMGEVLVELGLLTPAEVFEALEAQVHEKIVGVFQWLHFEHAFEPLDELPEDVRAFAPRQVEALVLAGVRTHFGFERIDPILASFAAHHPALRASPEQLAARFQMTPAERRLLRTLTGEHTLDAVRAVSPLDLLHTAQCLCALVLAKAIEWHAAPVAPRARASGADATLAAKPPAAPRPQAPGAAPPARPVAPKPASAPAPDPAGPSLAARGAAARSLSGLRSELARSGRPVPMPVDAKSARLEAERLFRQGLLMLEQPALPGALRAFVQACERVPDEPEYRMLEAWVEYLTAGDEARALARAKATAAAQRMLSRDRQSVRAHDILGELALATGDLDGAERLFRSAARMDPDDRGAARGLRSLERRRAAGAEAGAPRKKGRG